MIDVRPCVVKGTEVEVEVSALVVRASVDMASSSVVGTCSGDSCATSRTTTSTTRCNSERSSRATST